MTVTEFVKKYCIGQTCPHFSKEWGCQAYAGEECDAAFAAPLWHFKGMRERIDEHYERLRNKKKKGQE